MDEPGPAKKGGINCGNPALLRYAGIGHSHKNIWLYNNFNLFQKPIHAVF
jgi:hypothetical protein